MIDNTALSRSPLKAETTELGRVYIGTIKAIDSEGAAVVDFDQNREEQAIKAMSTVAISPQHISRKVALLFNNGDYSQPIIMGLIQTTLDTVIDNHQHNVAAQQNTGSTALSAPHAELTVNGRKIIIEGKDEVVLKCGDASISLNKQGKITIRGKQILNRATEVNRIMGGSVELN